MAIAVIALELLAIGKAVWYNMSMHTGRFRSEHTSAVKGSPARFLTPKPNVSTSKSVEFADLRRTTASDSPVTFHSVKVSRIC